MRILPGILGAGAWSPTVGLSLALTGCLGPDVDPAADSETGTTRALIQIDATSDGGEPEATAMAGFARIPASSDAEAVLDLVGWRLELPPTGSCAAPGSSAANATDGPIDPVDFLDAGDVVITAGEARATLAPRAVPTVSDLLSGVLYTTRDGSADPLPPGVTYEVSTTGGDGLSPLRVSAAAPAPLTGLRLGGAPIQEVTSVRAGVPLDLSWDVGAPGDLLVVELALDDGGVATCSFPDEVGAATVPAASVPSAGGGWLGVHRVRVTGFESPEIDRGELRFDLEREIDVAYLR
ncbi:MAG TPA: hypothetical protein PLU22_09135 [Polyangiaceae bacterium]|nr:hypothetical protein [Polyangiaceae bacterium]